MEVGDTVEAVRQRVTGDDTMTDRAESDDFLAGKLGILSTGTQQGPFALLVELVANIEVQLMSGESVETTYRENLFLGNAYCSKVICML